MTAWAACDPNNKNWQNLKAHFIAAYVANLESGPTANTSGYHEAAAALSDDDSLGSIKNSIVQMNMANIVNIRAMSESMSTANEEIRQALVAMQQQVAALPKVINQGHQAPALQPPAWAASTPPVGANPYCAAAATAPTGWSPPPQLSP